MFCLLSSALPRLCKLITGLVKVKILIELFCAVISYFGIQGLFAESRARRCDNSIPGGDRTGERAPLPAAFRRILRFRVSTEGFALRHSRRTSKSGVDARSGNLEACVKHPLESLARSVSAQSRGTTRKGNAETALMSLFRFSHI